MRKYRLVVGLAFFFMVGVAATVWVSLAWFPEWVNEPGGVTRLVLAAVGGTFAAEAAVLGLVKLVKELNENKKREPISGDARRPRGREGSVPRAADLPPGSRMPFGPNALFIGREADLLRLEALLVKPAAPGVVIVTAEGGCGKTQLAGEFCPRFGKYFAGVHWVKADEADLIGVEIARCGRAMQVPDMPDQPENMVDATLHALRDGKKRLVVLDNLESPEALRAWLPRLRPARVLVTARWTDWKADLGVTLHPLGMLARAESLALLRKLAGRLESVPDAELSRLAERLGDLPLALDLAGHYLERRKSLSPQGYLAEVEQSGGALEHLSQALEGADTPTLHRASLKATITLSWKALEGRGTANEMAQKLLGLAGGCAPNQPIPAGVLLEAMENEARDLPPGALEAGLNRLYDLGLLRRADGGPEIHPLIGEFAFRQAAGLEYKSGTAWRVVGWHLKGTLEFQRAKACLERALAITEHVYGLEAPIVAKYANELGLVLQDLGELRAARVLLERAMEIGEKTYGPEHPEVSRYANNLGMVLHDLGETQAARVLLERALAIGEKVYGSDHPEVGTLASNLGTLLKAFGKYEAARVLLERALAIDEKTYGPEHPSVGIRANNLGVLLQDLGEYSTARALLERALAIGEKNYGPEHPIVSAAASNLGLVLDDLGEKAAARALLERALAIDEKAYGPDHPSVGIRANNLGALLRELGKYEQARPLLERALRITEKAYGPDHPEVGITASNLGMLLHDMNDFQAARALLERALEMGERAFGPIHHNVATRANNLGLLLKDMGETQAAKAYLERALAVGEKTLGPNHPDVGTWANNLGILLQDLGETQAARAYLERALGIFEKTLPAGHTKIQAVRKNLEELGS